MNFFDSFSWRAFRHGRTFGHSCNRQHGTKPVFVDLESYLFLEIFHRWLIKAGEIEVTEMLPDPEHLFWKESNGRHSFELRTLIVPRS